jgi:DNA-directed RNA polymerase specialized sigma24 family protein
LGRVASTASSNATRQASLLGAAFRDLHGARLHGFALLVTLGDAARAASIASEVLAAGAESAAALRHPERAAAWLRARVVLAARRRAPRARQQRWAARRDALADLGVDRRTLTGLAALNVVERAAIVSLDVEHLDARDAETVLGLSTGALARVAARARRRYAAEWISARGQDSTPDEGDLGRHVRDAAHRALS